MAGSLDLSVVTGFETIGADLAATGGTVLTGHASAHTKGAWTELVASSAGEASWIEVIIGGQSASAQRYLIDIGIGAAASEVVVLPNLHFENVSATTESAHYLFPVSIPAGTRIAARCQSSSGGSDTIQVLCILWHGDPGALSAPGTVAAYGASAAASDLTSVDPGAVAHTKSAWVELTASTTDPIRWLMLALSRGGSSMIAVTRYLIDIGTGGAGSEVVLVANALAFATNISDSAIPRTLGFAVDIPAGTRIAVRMQSSSASAGDRTLDIGVYGADADDVASGGGQHAHAGWGD